MINWTTTKEENKTVKLIAERAGRFKDGYPVVDTEMDILATHLNGCRLRLRDFLKARKSDFSHDIHGIRNCLDRTTGKLQGVFLPRFHA